MNKNYNLPLDIEKEEHRFEYDEEEDGSGQDEFNDDGNEMVLGVHGNDMSESSHQSQPDDDQQMNYQKNQ
jgi:hypothetical protein